MRHGFPAAGLRGAIGLAAGLAMTLGTAVTTQAADGTFVLASTYLIDRLYPHPQTAGTQLYVDVLFDPLVTVTKDGIQPRLASAWSFSDDGLVLTLTLREDVTFHDGSPFNAEAAKAILTYTLTPENAARIPPYMAEATVEATGPYELTITLPAKAPEVLAVLSQYPMFKLDASGQPTDIGTGPFALGEFTTRQNAVFVRNDNYWGGPALLDAYEIRMFPEMSSALLSLEAREIDAVIRPPISEVARLDAIEGLEISSFPDTGNMMWGVNAREGRVTADVRVRKALDLAFDRERFVEVALAGVGTPTNVLWPPSSVAYSPEDETWRFDLDAAKALIDEAGVAGSELEFVLSSGVSQEVVSYVPIYQADLATIGITANVVDLDTSEWLDRITKGDFDVYMTIYGNTGADPALAFTSGNFRLTNNLPGFESPEYSAFEEAGRLETDPAKRIEIYRNLNAYVQEQAFALPFAQNPIRIVHWDNVDGIVLNSINNLFANTITAD